MKFINKTLCKEFDRFVNRMRKEWLAPGVGLGIVQGNRIVYQRSYGVRDIARNLPVTEQTKFMVASCTKSFTATAVGILVDEQKLDWDTPVRKYLPWFRMYDPVMTERLTVRDLLCHRSGLPRHDYVWFNNPLSRKEIAQRLKYLEPSKTGDEHNPYDFRNKYQYNNLMYILAGVLIEEVCGMNYEQFICERIFIPLGMHHTCFYTDQLQDDPEFAVSYQKVGNRVYPRIRGWLKDVGISQLIGAVAPAGGMVSTIADLCHWIIFQLNQGKIGGQQLISKKNLAELHTPQFINPPIYSYPERLNNCTGLGWMIESYRGERLVRHSGNLVGFSSHISFMPERNLGIVMTTNIGMSPLDPIIPLYFYDRMLGLEPIDWNQRKKLEAKKDERDLRLKQRKEFAHKPGSKPSLSLSDYSGVYKHPAYGKVVITVENGKLNLSYNRARFRLIHLEKDKFKMVEQISGGEKYRVSFVLRKSGRVASIAIPFEPSTQDIQFRKIS
ncbi:MAG: serine hydrolase [bacterium]|nr:serine hydrolase [bacterium]